MLGYKANIKLTVVFKDNFSESVIINNVLLIFAYIPPQNDFNYYLIDFFDRVRLIRQSTSCKHTIIMGDLNSRIGNFDHCDFTLCRSVKDLTVNTRGKILIDKILEMDLNILNGNSESDCSGDFTFVNHNGQSSMA